MYCEQGNGSASHKVPGDLLHQAAKAIIRLVGKNGTHSPQRHINA